MMIIGLCISPAGGVSDVSDHPGTVDGGDDSGLALFRLAGDMALGWNTHADHVFDSAWPTPDGEAVVFACTAQECGPHNAYGEHEAERMGLVGLVPHGDVYVIRLAITGTDGHDDSAEGDGLFAEMPQDQRDAIRAGIAREAAAVSRALVGAPVGA